MIIPAQNDIAFNLFGISVYWYGVIMAFAIFVSIICANKLLNLCHEELKKDIILEYSPIIIIFGVLCARLYFCFLNPTYYFSHPLEILDIREGGLSIHGAIIGGILSIFLLVKKYKLNFLTVIDPIACATFLGQTIGRWGNYFNSEAYGLPVAGQSWGLYIPLKKRISEFNQYDLFHPAFLYESILDFISFIILFFIYKKLGKQYKGLVFFSYMIFYALIRFAIESIRIDSALNIGSIPIAKIVSIIMLLVGIIGTFLVFYKQKIKNPSP